jgi:hypothetical protein
MKWIHLGLALLAVIAATEALMKAAGWVPFTVPEVVAVLPLSVSLLLRAISEFSEAEAEYLESKRQ